MSSARTQFFLSQHKQKKISLLPGVLTICVSSSRRLKVCRNQKQQIIHPCMTLGSLALCLPPKKPSMTSSLKLNRNLTATTSTMTKLIRAGLLLNWILLLRIQIQHCCFTASSIPDRTISFFIHCEHLKKKKKKTPTEKR